LSSNSRRIISVAVIFTAICLPVGEPSLAASEQQFVESTRAGLAALDNNNFAEAEKQLKAAMETAKLSKSPKYGEYTKSLINLGLLYEKKKESSQAEGYFLEAEKNYKEAFGEKSLEAAVGNQYLGNLYRKTGRYATAIKHYEKTKEVREVAAPNHPDLADTLAGLAECKAKTSARDESIPLMQKVISIRETAFGKNSGRVIKSRLMLASLYEQLGKPKLAAPAYQTVIDLGGPTEAKSGVAFERLAAIHDSAGRVDKADQCYKLALKARELHPGSGGADLNNCVKLYSTFLKGTNKADAAKQLEARFAKKPVK